MSVQLLKNLADHLARIDMPYMIIGGQAVLLYGEPRLTRDVDITLGTTPQRLGEVLGMVEAMELRLLVDDPADFVRQTWVLPALDEESGLRVDFIFSWTAYEQQAIHRAHTVDVAGSPVQFAAPEDVIIHKALAGRPRDWEDVRSILRKQDMDRSYIHRWLQEFSTTVAKDLVTPFEELYK
ncbi:MAG: nucleotidyl transferase AbiEii/AbiGii toxin family protein, partial [Anaerolineae bacterium]